MDERLLKTINGTKSWAELNELEKNISARRDISEEIATAIKTRSTALGTEYVVEMTGLVLAEMTEAEQAIVLAIGEYAAIMKRQGKAPSRTLQQIRSRGLIDAAEAAVSRKKPTQGFQILADADLEDLSYEQIVLDHVDEFSSRAVWYSRRTLGLENASEKPPAVTHSDVSTRTSQLVTWLKQRSEENGGCIPSFSNAEAATAIGLGDLSRFGRVQGNIQSRLDFACYRCDLPPLGCAAITPFQKAWGQDNRTWSFPVQQLQHAAQGRVWLHTDFDTVQSAANELPGIAHLSWQKAFREEERSIIAWVKRWEKFGLSCADDLDKRHTARLPAEILAFATPEFIWASVQRFLAEEVSHSFGPSTDYDLVVDGNRFPPKAVFGVALSLALHGKVIEPRHFSGGEGSVCFRLLREAGYMVIPKEQIVGSEITPEFFEKEWPEGERKLVQHWKKERATGLANAKKAQYRRVHGKLLCEKCGMDPVKHYGTPHAESCIEVHHDKVSISVMAVGHVTVLEDLKCLCANCHRLVHRMMSTAEPC